MVMYNDVKEMGRANMDEYKSKTKTDKQRAVILSEVAKWLKKQPEEYILQSDHKQCFGLHLSRYYKLEKSDWVFGAKKFANEMGFHSTEQLQRWVDCSPHWGGDGGDLFLDIGCFNDGDHYFSMPTTRTIGEKLEAVAARIVAGIPCKKPEKPKKNESKSVDCLCWSVSSFGLAVFIGFIIDNYSLLEPNDTIFGGMLAVCAFALAITGIVFLISFIVFSLKNE